MDSIISILKYRYKNYSETEKRIADYFIQANKNTPLKIKEVSEALYLSPSTVSRFVKKIGFQNYKELIYEITRSFYYDYEEQLQTNRVVENLRIIHQEYFSDLYTTIGSLDINFIVNKMQSAKSIYFFGFGKTNELLNAITFRLEDKITNTKVIPHYEHLIYTLEHVLNYENLIIILYENEKFKQSLDEVILIAKNKFIPIIVISLSKKVHDRKFAVSYILYPSNDLVITHYATTYYSPFLIFFDIIYFMLGDKKKTLEFQIY